MSSISHLDKPVSKMKNEIGMLIKNNMWKERGQKC